MSKLLKANCWKFMFEYCIEVEFCVTLVSFSGHDQWFVNVVIGKNILIFYVCILYSYLAYSMPPY